MLKRIIVLGDGEDSIDEMLKNKRGETSTNPIQTLVNRISIPTHLLDIDDEKLESARLCLVNSFKSSIEKSLDLLGIVAPDRM